MEAGKIYSDTGIITNNVNNDAKDLFEKSTGSITLENNWMHYEIIMSRCDQRRTVCEQTRTSVRAKANTSSPAGLESAGA
jgi:hypothetical protein